jgi:pyruvate/2-oxoglutarate dehydrogenase complex dihydrolipoamide acyltransferase (E2) component
MMNKQHDDYEVVPYPKVRRVLGAMYPSIQRRPMIHGLLEIDVTRARAFLREHKARTGEALSFTSFIITCLAQAVDENTSLHAYRKGRKHLVLFDEVDVATFVEREVAGHSQRISSLIRAANKKTFREIHQEIRRAQVEQVEVLRDSFNATHWVVALPMGVFRGFWAIFWRVRDRSPQVQKHLYGTVAITAVGMFEKGGGWGIPVAEHTLMITLGGIAEKPGVVDGTIAIRAYLSLTLSINHAIVDGAPAARFAQRLKDLIESGYGLSESEVEGPVVAR